MNRIKQIVIEYYSWNIKYALKINSLQLKYDIINAPEMYDLSHFTGRKADDFFPDWYILIKHSLNMILSQNKHSVALKL